MSSDEQLIDPKWKGKMSIQDPRGGAGLGTLTTMLAQHGEQYVRDLLSREDIVVTSDNRQMGQWLVRGQYPIAVGLADDILIEFQRQGLQFKVDGLGFPAKLSLGFGGIQLMNRAPHPNATKLYINWLLSRAGQEQIVREAQVNSRRLDVAPSRPELVIDQARMDSYVPHQYEDLLPMRKRAQQIAEELLK